MKEEKYYLKPAKECPICKGAGRFTIYLPDGSVCTNNAFCPHPDTNPNTTPLKPETESGRQT